MILARRASFSVPYCQPAGVPGGKAQESPLSQDYGPQEFLTLILVYAESPAIVRITSSYQFMTPATSVLGKQILVVLFFGMYLSLQISGMQFAPLPQFYDRSKQIN